MTDLERVLQGLDCVSGFGHCLQSEAFAGGICAYCMKEIAKKAKELLKEQEAVEPKLDVDSMVCGNCGHKLIHQDRIGDTVLFEERHNYCPQCGRQVKWDDNTDS